MSFTASLSAPCRDGDTYVRAHRARVDQEVRHGLAERSERVVALVLVAWRLEQFALELRVVQMVRRLSRVVDVAIARPTHAELDVPAAQPVAVERLEEPLRAVLPLCLVARPLRRENRSRACCLFLWSSVLEVCIQEVGCRPAAAVLTLG